MTTNTVPTLVGSGCGSVSVVLLKLLSHLQSSLKSTPSPHHPSLSSGRSAILIQLFTHLLLLWSSRRRTEDPDIYILPLTGKPEQQRFTMQIDVLTSTSSRQHGTISGRPLIKIIIIIIKIIRQFIRRHNMSIKSLQGRRTASDTRKLCCVIWLDK